MQSNQSDQSADDPAHALSERLRHRRASVSALAPEELTPTGWRTFLKGDHLFPRGVERSDRLFASIGEAAGAPRRAASRGAPAAHAS